jgi:hypothetical protein
MADSGLLSQAWRRALDLNIRYYSAIGRLATNYLSELVGAIGELSSGNSGDTGAPAPDTGAAASNFHASPTAAPVQPAHTHSPAHSHSAPPAAQSAAAAQSVPPAQPATMVLEGETGAKALGVFLVHNYLGEKVSVRVQASAFADESGNEIEPRLAFDPGLINLEPREQVLVRVVADIDKALKPGVTYRGELKIPELAGSPVPVALRRRPAPRNRSRGRKK